MSDTHAETVALVPTLAQPAFAGHQLTQRSQHLWKVATPGTWCYGFFLAVGPGAVMIYGDLGEAIFRMNASTEADVLAWVLRTSRDSDYVMSKLANRSVYRQFYLGDAVAMIKDRLREATGIRAENLQGLLNAIEWESGAVSAERFFWLCHEHNEYESLGAAENWSASAYWFAEALRCFARLYTLANAAPEPHEGRLQRFCE